MKTVENIEKIIRNLETQKLTAEVSEDFAKQMLKTFQKYDELSVVESPGLNYLTREKIDFSKKPIYLEKNDFRINDIRVYERNDTIIGLDIDFANYRRPEIIRLSDATRFAFIENEEFNGLYISKHSGDGTEKLPWETVYFKNK